jgi:alpha-glucuronidase
MRLTLVVSTMLVLASLSAKAEDGYELWLRYHLTSNPTRLASYRRSIRSIDIATSSPTLLAASEELVRALRGILGNAVPLAGDLREGALIVGTPASSRQIAALHLASALATAGPEGYVIRTVSIAGKQAIVIAANSDIGALYGTFAFLRELQSEHEIGALNIASGPKIQLRMLDHWDNIDRTVERGYAGLSLWEWDALPSRISPRYKDYARANASVGINGAALTNVNSNAAFLSAQYLPTVAAIAGVLRPYGVRVYLTARFTAPMELGGLKTADPLDPAVRDWWKKKIDELYAVIPDFGGFVVKANSEKQPGPQDYGRTHADGANMFAEALAPHGGVVIWRAFVYSGKTPIDRIAQAYEEFKPLDGAFAGNVLLQVKNGPLDFQPREPFHPLFGAMPKTPLMMEFQITKEYLGQDTHLVYLGAEFEEVLRADTYASGKGSTVARVIDGSLHGYARTGISGVANVGTDTNWTGSQFNQANWYAFGRLAWDSEMSSTKVANEWVRATFTTDPAAVARIVHMMMTSYEAAVDYMTPLGLTLLISSGHYGPAPWTKGRIEYHHGDSLGIGFDRSSTGSKQVNQYFPPVRDRYENLATVPDSLLLWFHHVPWTYRMKSGRTLWTELVARMNAGVDSVRSMQRSWNSVQGNVDAERFAEVRSFLAIQERESRWWRDAELAYFQTLSRQPIPAPYEKPAHDLQYYQAVSCPADRTKPRCETVP